MPLSSVLELALLLIGAGIAFVVGIWARPIGEAFGLLDHPDPAGGRKLHLQITPQVGGFAVVTAALLGVAVAAISGGVVGKPIDVAFWFALTVLAMFLIGVIDDRAGLSAPLRLGITTTVLLLPILVVPDFLVSELHFAFADLRFPLGLVGGAAFTLLCLVGLLNAVNMADGKNGLVIGQALIWALALSFRLPPELLPLIAALVGALVVLLTFNCFGKLFLGDGGSYAISAIFGLLAVFAWNRSEGAFYAGDIVVIFALPVFDTLRLIVHRMLLGKSPFTPGRDHLHHYLHKRWGWPAPLPFVLGLVAFTNVGALMMPGTGLYWAGVTLVGYTVMLLAAALPEPRASLRP
ncbi:MAG: glycosyltransferase family 4 protein [Thermaurantiacus sp.]